jgi:CheY-like chemotaxis protein
MKTILIVDDEFSIVETLKEIVEWEGYRVITAPNGQAGLVAAEQEHPALVLLDYMMPVMDGLQMLEKVRTHDGLAATPVIMMTAAPLGIPSAQKRWDALLLKPFDAEQLTRAIRGLIGEP